MATIWCYAERRRFDESEFVHDADGRLRIPEIHDRDVPHYANGGLLFPPDTPELPAVVTAWAAALELPTGLESFITRLLRKE
jgi:hypothetical protein